METFKERLIRHEGLELEPYRDTEGKLTIGVGRCVDTNPLSEEEVAIIGHDCRSKPITRDQAMFLLDNDINKSCKNILSHLSWAENIDPLRLEVLIEMCFQLGIKGLLNFKNTLACLEAGDVDGAVRNMLQSRWHAQTPARAEELATLMAKGGNQ